MNKKNTNKLFRDFPRLYRGRNKPMTESLMGFGFECGDGWYNLIHTLSAALENHMNESPKVHIEASQVKEKFGSLRFYIDGGDDYTLKLIDEAERQSATICEDCGAPAKLQRRRGWFATLCELCAFKKGYDAAPEPEEEEDVIKDIKEESPIATQVMCIKCRWVHFVNQDPQYKDYDWRCFRCGVVGSENFVTPEPEDIPYGSTIQQVNVVEPGK